MQKCLIAVYFSYPDKWWLLKHELHLWRRVISFAERCLVCMETLTVTEIFCLKCELSIWSFLSLNACYSKWSLCLCFVLIHVTSQDDEKHFNKLGKSCASGWGIKSLIPNSLQALESYRYLLNTNLWPLTVRRKQAHLLTAILIAVKSISTIT